MSEQVAPIPRAALDRLVRVVRLKAARDRRAAGSSTIERRRLRKLKIRARDLREGLSDPANLELRWIHDFDVKSRELQEMIADARRLEESVDEAIDELPRTKHKKTALPIAAMGFVHLNAAYGSGRPVLSDRSPAVQLLQSICEKAGLHYAPETVRGALGYALELFDHQRCPDCCKYRSRFEAAGSIRLERFVPKLGSLRFGDEEITFQVDS